MKLFFNLFLLLMLLTLVSCSQASGGDNSSDGDGNGNIEPNPDESENIGEIKFSEIVYSRPDASALLSHISDICDMVNNGQKFEAVMADMKSVSRELDKFLTMHSYALIRVSIDASDSEFAEEYARLSEALPEVRRAVDALYALSKASDNADRYETEVFGAGYFSSANKAEYSDRVISLLKEEADAEARYSAMSTANVRFSYDGRTMTYKDAEKYLAAKYGENTAKYDKALADCKSKHDKQYADTAADIFVELLSIRRLIANELGYESYAEYAYALAGRGYAPREAKVLIADVSRYLVPVYSELSSNILNPYLKNNLPQKVTVKETVNALYGLYCENAPSLADLFERMMKRSLYDVRPGTPNRYDGAFTVYLDECGAPFIFMSARGGPSDLFTLSHEFGHFARLSATAGKEISLDLAEVYSEGLEFLTLAMLEDDLFDGDYKYVLYYKIAEAFETLIMQSFYSSVELSAYALEYDEITREAIEDIVASAAASMGLGSTALSDIVSRHLLLYPTYVQSYATALIPAAELFFKELESDGSGVSIYLSMLSDDGKDGSVLLKAGLTSPSEKDAIRNLADKIYFLINGSHYYNEADKLGNAA